MKILSIHCGHNATAALLDGDRVVAAISEERFNRLKNYSGFPFESVEWIMKNFLQKSNLDLIVLPSNDPAFYFSRGQYEKNLVSSRLISKVSDAISGGRQNKEEIRKSSFVRKIVKFFPIAIHWYSELIYVYIRLRRRHFRRQIIQRVAKITGVPENKVRFEDHHTMHAASALFWLNPAKPWVILTADGYGDDLCSTVSIYKEGKLTRIAQTHQQHSLGMLYAYTTRYLGMKSNEHEFKVMGLAPYAKEKYVEPIVKKLRQLIWVDKQTLTFKSSRNLMRADLYLDEIYKGHRFDAIAGAVQKITEELLCQLAKAAVKKTSIKNIAGSGGVFMNVKASMHINELPEVAELFVVPSAGDESLVFGGLFVGYLHLTNSAYEFLEFSGLPRPVTDLYLGNEQTDSEIEKYIQEQNLNQKYKIKKMKNAPKEVAKLLADGEVVARLNGRMEWGARALGNRSILANPSDPKTIRLINEMIKDRDFWMPFTPSILDTDEARYIKNPKNMAAPYMCITFRSTEEAQKDLIAALHPYDFTVRPQIVYRDWNPDYYDLISEFRRLTGIGGILNTSFNLHGEPNVCTISDAVRALKNSGLKYLAAGSYLISK